MNDTIRNLAQEADVWCDQNCIDHPFYNVQWEQKFAELIVKECAKSAYDWYQHHDQLHWDPATHILAHFGVEE